MRDSVLLLAFAMAMSGVPVRAESPEVPHLVKDIAAGDIDHAATHFAANAAITTYSYGREVSASVAGLVEEFRACRFIQFGRSDFPVNRQFDVLTFDCGRPYNYAIHTGGRVEGIESAVFYAEATAPPPAPPARLRAKEGIGQ